MWCRSTDILGANKKRRIIFGRGTPRGEKIWAHKCSHRGVLQKFPREPRGFTRCPPRKATPKCLQRCPPRVFKERPKRFSRGPRFSEGPKFSESPRDFSKSLRDFPGPQRLFRVSPKGFTIFPQEMFTEGPKFSRAQIPETVFEVLRFSETKNVRA